MCGSACASSSVGCDTVFLLRANEQLVQWVTADQVEQWKQEDPHYIDKVPVQAEIVDGRGVPSGISVLRSLIKQRKQDGDADDHVQRVHPGHGEVEEEEDLRVLRHVRRQGHIALVCGMHEILDREVRAGDVMLRV